MEVEVLKVQKNMTDKASVSQKELVSYFSRLNADKERKRKKTWIIVSINAQHHSSLSHPEST